MSSNQNTLLEIASILQKCEQDLLKVMDLTDNVRDSSVFPIIILANNGGDIPRFDQVIKAVKYWTIHAQTEGAYSNETKDMTAHQKSLFFMIKAMEASGKGI